MTIREDNYKFLSNLQGNEHLSVDKEGRIIKTPDVNIVSQVATDAMKDAQNVAMQFILKKLEEPHDELEDRLSFNDRVFHFFEAKLINAEQRKEILKMQREKRLQELDDYDPELASTIVALECANNINYSDEEREFYSPIAVKSGYSGSYFLKNLKGAVTGIFKPEYHEYGMPLNPKGKVQNYDPNKPKETQLQGHIQGTSWLNEIAAYEISDPLIKVPETTEITVLFPASNGQYYTEQGSFQKFVKAQTFAELSAPDIDSIPPKEIQKIAVFDMLTVNGDRHWGNLFFDGKSVIPIDHGLCFLNKPHIYGAWFTLPQMQVKLDGEVRDWILNFDIDESMEKLELLSIDRKSLIMHKTMFLFLVSRINKGENLNQIAKYCVKIKGSDASTVLDLIVATATEQARRSGKDFEEEYFKLLEVELDNL